MSSMPLRNPSKTHALKWHCIVLTSPKNSPCKHAPLRLDFGLPPSPHHYSECSWGNKERSRRWLCDCASKGVAREGWQAGTSSTKVKCLGVLTCLPECTCLCSPIYTLCSNTKCNSGRSMACAAGNMTSARCVPSHIFGTESIQESRGKTVSLGCKLLTCQFTEALCECSCSSTKKACLRRETGTWIQGWECAAVTTDVFVTNGRRLSLKNRTWLPEPVFLAVELFL